MQDIWVYFRKLFSCKHDFKVTDQVSDGQVSYGRYKYWKHFTKGDFKKCSKCGLIKFFQGKK